jgi:hypothetical protein
MNRVLLLGIAALPMLAVQQASQATVLFSDGFENYAAAPVLL